MRILLRLTLILFIGTGSTVFAQEQNVTAEVSTEEAARCSRHYFESAEDSFTRRWRHSAFRYRAERRLKSITQHCAGVTWYAEAKEHLQSVQEELAKANLEIALFYLQKFHDGSSISLKGASSRLANIVEKYPNFSQMDQVLARLGETKILEGELDEAASYYIRVTTEFPTSQYVGESLIQANQIMQTVEATKTREDPKPQY